MWGNITYCGIHNRKNSTSMNKICAECDMPFGDDGFHEKDNRVSEANEDRSENTHFSSS